MGIYALLNKLPKSKKRQGKEKMLPEILRHENIRENLRNQKCPTCGTRLMKNQLDEGYYYQTGRCPQCNSDSYGRASRAPGLDTAQSYRRMKNYRGLF